MLYLIYYSYFISIVYVIIVRVFLQLNILISITHNNEDTHPTIPGTLTSLVTIVTILIEFYHLCQESHIL